MKRMRHDEERAPEQAVRAEVLMHVCGCVLLTRWTAATAGRSVQGRHVHPAPCSRLLLHITGKRPKCPSWLLQRKTWHAMSQVLILSRWPSLLLLYHTCCMISVSNMIFFRSTIWVHAATIKLPSSFSGRWHGSKHHQPAGRKKTAMH